MFKVISAEIKKMVSKPGIYVLAVFLAVILVLGVLIYNPEVKPTSDASKIFSQTGFTLANYNTEKGKYDSYIESSKKAVNSYKLTYTAENTLKIAEYRDIYDRAKVAMNTALGKDSNNNENKKEQEDAAKGLMNSILDIDNFLNKQDFGNLNSVEGSSYAIFTSTENKNTLAECLENIRIEYNTAVSSSDYQSFYGEFGKINRQFEQCIENYYFPKLPSKTIADYTETLDAKNNLTKYGTVEKNLQEIDEKINELFEGVNGELSYNNGKKLDEFIKLINDYANTTNSYLNMVKYELLSNAFDSLKTNKQYILTNISNETEFSANTNYVKYNYIFKNHKVVEDYSSPLAVGTTIGNEKSAYDYSYFILKLFSIVILTYAIMSACHTIAGEIKEGSMRYFAIRPISRGEILFGKLISVVLMSTIILLFSAIISLVVGAGVYGGLNTNAILTIFNGKTAMVIHPLAMLGLYLLSFIVQIVIYASIALMLSTLIKSDLLSITIMLLIYILNILLPVFAGGMSSWLMFYPFSHISLFALFGSSLYANSNDLLSKLLAENVYAGTSLLTISIVSLLLIIVPLVISKLAFKNKEL